MTDDTYRCFGSRCTRTFESLDDMVLVAGAGYRSGRHFCASCAKQQRRTPEEAYHV